MLHPARGTSAVRLVRAAGVQMEDRYPVSLLRPVLSFGCRVFALYARACVAGWVVLGVPSGTERFAAWTFVPAWDLGV
jgi:hypothetical protein